MRLWLYLFIFLSYGQCWYFLVSSWSYQVHATSSNSLSVGCCSHANLAFKSFMWFLPCGYHSVASHDLGGDLSVNSVLKSLECWLESDPRMCSLKASPGVYNEFYGVPSLSSSLPVTTLLLSGSLGLLFCPPVRNPGLYLPYFATHTHKCAMSGSKE